MLICLHVYTALHQIFAIISFSCEFATGLVKGGVWASFNQENNEFTKMLTRENKVFCSICLICYIMLILYKMCHICL